MLKQDNTGNYTSISSNTEDDYIGCLITKAEESSQLARLSILNTHQNYMILNTERYIMSLEISFGFFLSSENLDFQKSC